MVNYVGKCVQGKEWQVLVILESEFEAREVGENMFENETLVGQLAVFLSYEKHEIVVKIVNTLDLVLEVASSEPVKVGEPESVDSVDAVKVESVLTTGSVDEVTYNDVYIEIEPVLKDDKVGRLKYSCVWCCVDPPYRI